MAAWQFDIDLVPTRDLDIDVVKREISSLLPKATTWSDAILIWGDIDGTSIQLCDDGTPPELLVRCDMRIHLSQFLCDLVAFAKRMRYQFTNADGKVIPSTVSDIGFVIANSEAFRFVSNPEKFLESLTQ